MTYSESIKKLDAIVRRIESGEMDVDELAANLKEAKKLIASCQKRLTEIDDEVKKILEA